MYIARAAVRDLVFLRHHRVAPPSADHPRTRALPSVWLIQIRQ